MAAFLNLAEVFVSVPRSDLLSISVLEGMACGCVPILADLLAYKSRVVHGENGFMVLPENHSELAECILRALNEPETRIAFCEKNVELVRTKDSWRHNAPILLDLYRTLMDNINE